MKMNRWMYAAALTALIAGATSMPAAAQWTQAPGPGGGNVRAIAAHPDGLVVSLQYDRLYRYSSATGQWTRLDDLETMRLDASGGSIVASTVGGLMRSTDQGTTWSSVGPTNGIVVDASERRLYAVDNEKLHRSTDDGATWHRFADLSPNVLAVATADPIVLVGVDAEPGFVRSTDGGTSWRIVSEGLPADAWPVRIRRVGSAFYAAIRGNRPHRNHGIYRSLDSGRTWSAFNEGLPLQEPTGYPWVLQIGSHGERAFASTSVGVFELTAEGWTKISDQMAIVADSDSSGIVIGTSTGVYHRAWQGASFVDRNAGLAAADINAALEIDGALLAASAAGVHRSSDGGATWSVAIGSRIAQLIDAGGMLFARAEPYDSTSIHRSTDGGLTWSAASSGILDPRMAVSVIAASSQVIYAGLHEIAGIGGGGIEWRAGGIFRSTDGAATWTPVNTGLPRSAETVVPIVHLAAFESTVVAATAGGLYHSSDRGASWRSSQFDPSNGYVSSLAQHDGVYYLTAGSRIFRSTDAGATWSRFDAGTGEAPTNGFHSVGRVLIAHARFAAPQRFFRLDGERWTEITARMPQDMLVSSIAPAGTALVVGTHDAGLWLGGGDIVAGVAPERSPSLSAAVLPNPAGDHARLDLWLEAPSTVTLEIVDALGRVVERRRLGRLDAGEQHIPLALASLTSGTYRFRVITPEGMLGGGFVRR